MDIQTLELSELHNLIWAYDKYICEHTEEDYKQGWRPVCLNEFYDNEFQEI